MNIPLKMRIDGGDLNISATMQNEAVGLELDSRVEMSMDYNALYNKPMLDGRTIQGDIREQDPTVPDWAKTQTRPTYTAEDVGAIGRGELTEIPLADLEALWNAQ